MRPIRLTMEAFGPYIKKSEIDFREFGDRGIYLINGNTGVGKTTIFDAITFALYGELSGDIREGSMMRSKYADPSQETFVEFEFECRGKIYKIKRSPSYTRAKKRGDGMTESAASVLLTMPDGSTFEKGVNEKIESEILMLDRDQFCKTIMIAQGDYLKLLHATSKEREPLLRTLFGTEKYDILRTRLNEEKKKLVEERENIKRDILSVSSFIKFEDDLSLEVNADIQAKAANTGVLTEITEKLIALGEKKKVQFEGEQKSLAGNYEKAVKDLNHAEENNKKLKELEEMIKKLNVKIKEREQQAEGLAAEGKKYAENRKKLEDEKETLKDAEAALERCKAEKQKAQKELEDAKALAARVAELAKIRKDITEKHKDHEGRKAEKTALEDKHDKLTAETEQLRKRAEELNGEEAKCTALEAEKKTVQTKTKDVKDLINEFKKLETNKKNLEKAREQFKAADNDYEDKNKEYESLNRAFLCGQAGVLAEHLMEGEECPVCGSTHHPKKAVRGVDVPSEQILNNAKYVKEQAENKRREASENAGRLDGEYKKACENLNKKADELLGSHDDIEANSQKKLEELGETERRILKEIDEKNKLITERNDNLDKAKKNEEELKKIAAKIAESEKLCSELLKNISEAEGRRTEMEETLSNDFEKRFGDRTVDGAEEKASEINKKAEDELKKARKAVNDEQKRVGRKNDLAKDLEKLTQNEKKNEEKLAGVKEELAADRRSFEDKKAETDKLRSDPDFDGSDETLAIKNKTVTELRDRKGKIETDLGNVINRIRDNRKAAENLAEKGVLLANADKRYTMVEELEKTASGNVGGQNRITFETYVLQENFRGMVEHANRLLMQMTDDHYSLETAIQDKKSQKAGLDLELFDHWNDTTRKVQTLSGGESFLAALALALGLAEEVQSSKGGVQLDSMFVDEGFGTLDEESLDLVMNALSELSNDSSRLIGIISHVDELKNRIDNQITITKDVIKGSTATVSC